MLDRHHWGNFIRRSMQALNNDSARRFGLSLFLMTAVLEALWQWVTIYVIIPPGDSPKQNASFVILLVEKISLTDIVLLQNFLMIDIFVGLQER
jgi:hypothetical protein